MPLTIDALHHALRVAHIAVGFAGLALFWVPVLSRKGGAWHVLAGRAFVLCTLFIGTSGVVSSGWALAHRASFIGPYGPEAVAGEGPRIVEFIFAVLGYLSVAVLEAAIVGVAVVRTKRRHSELNHGLVKTLILARGVVATALAGFGGARLAELATAPTWPTMWGLYPIALVVGVLGAAGAWRRWRYVVGPAPSEREWFFQHVRNMLGLGTGFYTAFAVFGFNRLFPGLLTGAWALVPWIGVPVVGIVATEIVVAWYRRPEIAKHARTHAILPK